MVVFDSCFLSVILHPTAKPPLDAEKKPIDRVKERTDLLLKTLTDARERIIIPTPALCEFLVLADQDGPQYLAKFSNSPIFLVVPFDLKAAIELAAIRLQITAGLSKRIQRRRSTNEETWAKISFDRQIVAIAKANNAHTVYSDDKGLRAFAKQTGLQVIGISGLPLPKDVQVDLPFDEEEKNQAKTKADDKSSTQV